MKFGVWASPPNRGLWIGMEPRFQIWKSGEIVVYKTLEEAQEYCDICMQEEYRTWSYEVREVVEVEKPLLSGLQDYYEAWSKCSFCGRHNGMYGRPLEQHSPRCYYKGDADEHEVVVPNYSKYIAQDDEVFLPMIWAYRDFPMVKKENDKLKAEIDQLKLALEKYEPKDNQKKIS